MMKWTYQNLLKNYQNIDLGCLISSDVILGQTFAIYV